MVILALTVLIMLLIVIVIVEAVVSLFMTLVMLFVLMTFYVLDSLMKAKVFSLFKIAPPSYGWIPFYSDYLLGKVCNGKDGYNIGVLGVVFPNWFFEYGWLLLIPAYYYFGLMSLLCVCFLYYGSIFTFIYSRMEGKYEAQVRAVAIISSLVRIVAQFKILSSPVSTVYSVDNDVYPEEFPSDDYEDNMYDGPKERRQPHEPPPFDDDSGVF